LNGLPAAVNPAGFTTTVTVAGVVAVVPEGVVADNQLPVEVAATVNCTGVDALVLVTCTVLAAGAVAPTWWLKDSVVGVADNAPVVPPQPVAVLPVTKATTGMDSGEFAPVCVTLIDAVFKPLQSVERLTDTLYDTALPPGAGGPKVTHEAEELAEGLRLELSLGYTVMGVSKVVLPVSGV
jgi:hypothetical protein